MKKYLLATGLAFCLILSGCQSATAEQASTELPDETQIEESLDTSSEPEPALDLGATAAVAIEQQSESVAVMLRIYEIRAEEAQKAAEEAARIAAEQQAAAQKAAEEAAAQQAAAAQKAAEDAAAQKAAEEAAAKKAADEAAALKTAPAASTTVKEETGSNYLESVEANVLKKVNQERVANGLAELTLDTNLRSAARIRSKELYKEDHWAHTRPNGDPWYTVLQVEVPYSHSYAGENLAYRYTNDPNDTKAKSASFWVTEWINSPGHYENMLRDTYTHAGVGIYYVKRGDVTYAYATMIFATPQ